MVATELRSEAPSLAASPRISFSHDLSQHDVVPIEPSHHHFRSNSSAIDFNFSVICESFDHESSSADELFSDGKLLPSQIKTKPILIPPNGTNQTHQPETNLDDSKTEGLVKSSDEKQSSARSFWRFKRSCSLNGGGGCGGGGGGGYGRGLWPLPPLLSRSLSTGSAPAPAPVAGSSKTQSKSRATVSSKQNWLRSFFSTNSAAKAQVNSSCSSGNYSKPPLKKKGRGSYGKGVVRVNPVLNVPSGNLFGFGSIFSNGKDKNKKK